MTRTFNDTITPPTAAVPTDALSPPYAFAAGVLRSAFREGAPIVDAENDAPPEAGALLTGVAVGDTIEPPNCED